MFRRFAVCALIAAVTLSLVPTRSPAASKEIMELQRDVAAIQEQLRQLKESQDKQLSALTVLVQQALDTSSKSSTGVAVIQSNLQQSLKDLEGKVVTPVAGLSARLDGIDQETRAVQQSVGDLAGTLSKLQQQLTDLNHAVAILQAPAPPPPGATTTTGGGGAGMQAAAPDAPCSPATQLYADANRDRGQAHYDIALKEYAEYLRCYGNQDVAPSAQFFIGSIHAAEGDFEAAVKDFDVVLEKYPDNNRTADSLYSKGLALKKLGRPTEAASEFGEVIKRFRTSDLAVQACEQRKALGFNCPVPNAPKQGKKKK